MLKRILLGVSDPQHTMLSGQYARAIAQHHQASVTVVAVTDERRLRDVGPVAVGAGSFAKEMVADRFARNERVIHASVDELTRFLSSADIAHEVVYPEGPPYESLADLSRYHDLMIFSRTGLMEHGITNEPSHEMVHLIESGVRPILATGDTYAPVTRVYAGYSGSIESAHTIRQCVQFGIWPDAMWKVAHFGGSADASDTLLAEMESYLTAHGISAEFSAEACSAKQGLMDAAQAWNAELIVVGNSAKSWMRRRVFGETALKVIQEAALPLFLSQ